MAVKRAKLGPGLRVHGLRHGYGSLLIAGGHDVGTVSRALGHAKASITLDIYTHEFAEQDTAAGQRMAAELDARFGSHTGHSG